MTHTSTYTAGRRVLALSLLALALSLLAAAVAGAADGPPASAPAVVARTGYADGFVEFWTTAFKKQSGVVMGMLGLAVICIFIITRGKWLK
ncbi:hypothetical protein [Fimbriiglobus ruber]|uniref:hypothetical protein n=1 Tax=Fimbriiglobus ruber TaxID=1908690 RepID=UPI00117A00D0|nr:hypothetical protein [Fimbriiglobus ruber]